MAMPVAGDAGDGLALGDGDLRAAEQLHRRQVSQDEMGKDSLLSMAAPVAGVVAVLLALPV